jgi:pyroglutamyl-peptidase
MTAPRTVLLTGFTPFPGVPVNLTATLVPQIAAHARRRFAQGRFVARVLPTEWAAAPLVLDELVARHQPDVVVHFGVDGSAEGFEIETQGINVCAARADAAGALPASVAVIEGAAERLAASLPVARILARLAARGIPARASDDAGRYLCNFVLYRSLHHAAGVRERQMRAGFVHLPPAFSPLGLTSEAALEGALEIVAACLDE